jgi:hypothetical protein
MSEQKREVKPVTYIPACCSECGKQVALIAVAPLMKGQRIYVTVDSKAHSCTGGKTQAQVTNGEAE